MKSIYLIILLFYFPSAKAVDSSTLSINIKETQLQIIFSTKEQYDIDCFVFFDFENDDMKRIEQIGRTGTALTHRAWHRVT